VAGYDGERGSVAPHSWVGDGVLWFPWWNIEIWIYFLFVGNGQLIKYAVRPWEAISELHPQAHHHVRGRSFPDLRACFRS
jgi:hypothetical protein